MLGLRETRPAERDLGDPTPAVTQGETPPGDWLFGGSGGRLEFQV